MQRDDATGPIGPDPASLVGQTLLGRYRVEKILGHGGMGEVLLANDRLLHRRVALKRVRGGADGAERRAAILREARRASEVNDPRIAAIHDILDLESDVVLVMEYVDGTTLRERMSQPLPLPEFWNVAFQCVGALAAAHERGVVHRDIKPENVMITHEGRIKILDFGIARRAATGGESPAITVTSTMTTEARAPFIAGTPQYMAPEAHFGDQVDARTDIFSLGTVFYEMLTARNPFAGPSYDVVVQRVMTTQPEPASRVNPSVGPALSAVIARMMEKDRAKRYPTCSEVERHLSAVKTPGVTARVLAIENAIGALTRHPLRRAVVASAIALLVVTGAAWSVWLRLGTALPAERNLAVLAPRVSGGKEEFAAMALGTIDVLAARLQKHQEHPGFQLAPFAEGLDESVASADDAHKVQGANLALLTTLEERTDSYRARLELWDAKRNRQIAVRTFETPTSQPFVFLDRIYRDSARMLGLPPLPGSTSSEMGVRGAGTLRFVLQGIGRIRTATTVEQARRAVEDIELACRSEPDAALARGWRSNAELSCFFIGHDPAWLERAVASAREAVARDSASVEAHLALATALEQKKDRTGALAEFRRVVELDPADDASVLRVARNYTHLGQEDLERETYSATISRRPHCWQPYWWLATWYFRHGRFDESAGAYRSMIRRAPDLYRGYSSLGGLLVLTGAYEQAIDTLKLSIALRPNEVAFDNIGTAYFNSDRLDDTIAAYNQAFQYGFADCVSWMNLGDAYYYLRGRRDHAAEAYAEAIRLGREENGTRKQKGQTIDVIILASLATIFPKIDQPDSARVYLARALEADSSNARVQQCAALTWWQLGDRPRALSWLERSVRGGYPATWLRDSPMFEDWRADSTFRTLVAGAGPRMQQTSSPRKGGRT